MSAVVLPVFCQCIHSIWDHPDATCTGEATERLVLHHKLSSLPVCYSCAAAIRRAQKNHHAQPRTAVR